MTDLEVFGHADTAVDCARLASATGYPFSVAETRSAFSRMDSISGPFQHDTNEMVEKYHGDLEDWYKSVFVTCMARSLPDQDIVLHDGRKAPSTIKEALAFSQMQCFPPLADARITCENAYMCSQECCESEARLMIHLYHTPSSGSTATMCELFNEMYLFVRHLNDATQPKYRKKRERADADGSPKRKASQKNAGDTPTFTDATETSSPNVSVLDIVPADAQSLALAEKSWACITAILSSIEWKFRTIDNVLVPQGAVYVSCSVPFQTKIDMCLQEDTRDSLLAAHQDPDELIEVDMADADLCVSAAFPFLHARSLSASMFAAFYIEVFKTDHLAIADAVVELDGKNVTLTSKFDMFYPEHVTLVASVARARPRPVFQHVMCRSHTGNGFFNIQRPNPLLGGLSPVTFRTGNGETFCEDRHRERAPLEGNRRTFDRQVWVTISEQLIEHAYGVIDLLTSMQPDPVLRNAHVFNHTGSHVEFNTAILLNPKNMFFDEEKLEVFIMPHMMAYDTQLLPADASVLSCKEYERYRFVILNNLGRVISKVIGHHGCLLDFPQEIDASTHERAMSIRMYSGSGQPLSPEILHLLVNLSRGIIKKKKDALSLLRAGTQFMTSRTPAWECFSHAYQENAEYYRTLHLMERDAYFNVSGRIAVKSRIGRLVEQRDYRLGEGAIVFTDTLSAVCGVFRGPYSKVVESSTLGMDLAYAGEEGLGIGVVREICESIVRDYVKHRTCVYIDPETDMLRLRTSSEVEKYSTETSDCSHCLTLGPNDLEAMTGVYKDFVCSTIVMTKCENPAQEFEVLLFVIKSILATGTLGKIIEAFVSCFILKFEQPVYVHPLTSRETAISKDLAKLLRRRKVRVDDLKANPQARELFLDHMRRNTPVLAKNLLAALKVDALVQLAYVKCGYSAEYIRASFLGQFKTRCVSSASAEVYAKAIAVFYQDGEVSPLLMGPMVLMAHSKVFFNADIISRHLLLCGDPHSHQFYDVFERGPNTFRFSKVVKERYAQSFAMYAAPFVDAGKSEVCRIAPFYETVPGADGVCYLDPVHILCVAMNGCSFSRISSGMSFGVEDLRMRVLTSLWVQKLFLFTETQLFDAVSSCSVAHESIRPNPRSTSSLMVIDLPRESMHVLRTHYRECRRSAIDSFDGVLTVQKNFANLMSNYVLVEKISFSYTTLMSLIRWILNADEEKLTQFYKSVTGESSIPYRSKQPSHDYQLVVKFTKEFWDFKTWEDKKNVQVRSIVAPLSLLRILQRGNSRIKVLMSDEQGRLPHASTCSNTITLSPGVNPDTMDAHMDYFCAASASYSAE